MIDYEELFAGSLGSALIYPRVLLQQCLHHNAASIIVAHNHPSSSIAPSPEDIAMTSKMIKALELVEVQVLDHIIVGKQECLSFAENGLLCVNE